MHCFERNHCNEGRVINGGRCAMHLEPWKWYAHWCHHGSQGKPAIFWFQLGTNFSGSEPIYFWSKCSERFKIRCANRNGTRSVLVERAIRAIIKKFKRYGTVENLMGRGHNCILAPRILRRMVREATKSPRITVKELQALVASWDHQVSKSTIWRHLHNHKTQKKTLGVCQTSFTLWLEPSALVRWEPKLNVFVRYSMGMFGIGTEMHTRRSTSYPRWNMVVGQSCFRAVLIPEV